MNISKIAQFILSLIVTRFFELFRMDWPQRSLLCEKKSLNIGYCTVFPYYVEALCVCDSTVHLSRIVKNGKLLNRNCLSHFKLFGTSTNFVWGKSFYSLCYFLKLGFRNFLPQLHFIFPKFYTRVQFILSLIPNWPRSIDKKSRHWSLLSLQEFLYIHCSTIGFTSGSKCGPNCCRLHSGRAFVCLIGIFGLWRLVPFSEKSSAS